MTTKRTQSSCLLLLPIVLSACSFAFAQVGDSCTVEATGVKGTCKIPSDCPSAEEQAKNGIRITRCGFYQLTVPIVCCENNEYRPEPNDNTFFSEEPNPDAFIYPSEPETERPHLPSRRPHLTKSEQKHQAAEAQNLINLDLAQFNVVVFDRLLKVNLECLEYSKMTTGVVQAIPLVTNTEAVSINIVKCDYNSVALIVGGKPANAGEFPFMAAIGFNVENNIEWRCGGTLISDEYILTAAHCTFSIDADAPTVVRLGDLDLARSDDGSVHEDFNVKNIIVHPGYKYPQRYNDIALIQLSSRVKFTKYIRPACLYTKSRVNQSQAIATGWGRTDYATDLSSKLMKVSLSVYSNDECVRTYQPDKKLPQGVTSSMLCAGELKGGKDTCQGDSGGPLLITKKGNQCKFYIIGVTSFGKSCGQVNTPAVYTKVSHYVSWIEKTIW